MMKVSIILPVLLLSCSAISAAVCEPASETNAADFCNSFKKTASCYCVSAIGNNPVCNDPHKVYDLMMIRYKTQDRACAAQPNTSKQKCLDSWNCYRMGGVDSIGRPCSGTGARCYN